MTHPCRQLPALLTLPILLFETPLPRMLSPPNVVVELTESPDSSASVWEPSFPEYGLDADRFFLRLVVLTTPFSASAATVSSTA